jgi:hypothetical protein
MAFTNNPRPLCPDGIASVIRITEANSQSFVGGQLVVYSSGITAVATSGTKILGIALADATNVTTGNATILVQRITPEQDYAIKCISTATVTSASAFTPLTKYGLAVASNVCYLQLTNTTDDACVFLESIKDENGDATNWARVRFLSAVIQTDAAGT